MEEVFRPEPTRNLPERAQAWIGWFGLTRLIASAVAVVIVCGGAYWLVSTPPPPSEAALPRVQAATPPMSTLPLPVGAASAPPDSALTTTTLIVHVAGAVSRPGVYEVPGDGRVQDALDRAGGPTADAQADALNLAAPVIDGSRIYVPTVDEAIELPLLVEAPSAAAPGGDAEAAPSGPIDVNQATAAQLDMLPGVGPATATAIVTERQTNGPYLSVDELERVLGIGPAKLGQIRDLVTV